MRWAAVGRASIERTNAIWPRQIDGANSDAASLSVPAIFDSTPSSME